MTTNLVVDAAIPELLAGSAVDFLGSCRRDVLLADATAHLLSAYQAIDEFSRTTTEPWSSRAFVSACQSLCATLIAIDEFSESTWANV
jgi:hypothetical protein